MPRKITARQELIVDPLKGRQVVIQRPTYRVVEVPDIWQASEFSVDPTSTSDVQLAAAGMEVLPGSYFPRKLDQDSKWQPLPYDPEIAGPSGEEGQVQLVGEVCAVTLFARNELDWHVWLRLDAQLRIRMQDVIDRYFRTDIRTLAAIEEVEEGNLDKDFFRDHCRVGDTDTFPGIFCEFMVLDGYRGSDDYWSADVQDMLKLMPEEFTYAFETQSEDEDDATKLYLSFLAPHGTGEFASKPGARVYMQGLFVYDDGHSWWEIHPLDSLAYAERPGRGEVLTDADPWPRDAVIWRVYAVSNSSLHRMNTHVGPVFLKRNRSTRWYLELPAGAYTLPESALITVEITTPGFRRRPVPEDATTPGGAGLSYPQYQADFAATPGFGANTTGSGDIALGSFPIDPRDGRRKLRLDITTRWQEDRRWFGAMLRVDVQLAIRA